jgi:hypothetical protein
MKNWRFTVTGRGHFPIDMLRYDSAWPAGPIDVELIPQHIGYMPAEHGVAIIDLISHSYSGPTDARWASFGWTVTSKEKMR